MYQFNSCVAEALCQFEEGYHFVNLMSKGFGPPVPLPPHPNLPFHCPCMIYFNSIEYSPPMYGLDMDPIQVDYNGVAELLFKFSRSQKSTIAVQPDEIPAQLLRN